jgi:nucleotide-binding universal stress UspA family protein
MTVVVGVDGSPESYAALRIGQEEASLRGTELVAVMAYGGEGVLGAPAGRPLGGTRSGSEDRELASSTLRSVLKAALGPDDVTVQAEVEAGQPGRVLVETARARDAVMVVLAARKERTPSRLLGAVSQYVLRNAPCPVLVVPEASKAR